MKERETGGIDGETIRLEKRRDSRGYDSERCEMEMKGRGETRTRSSISSGDEEA